MKIMINGVRVAFKMGTYPVFGLNMSPNEDAVAVAECCDCCGCEWDCMDETAEKAGAGMVDIIEVVVTGHAGPS